MSIWQSSTVAGADEDGTVAGTVVSYINGWSNHYPGTDLPHNGIEAEEAASIGLGQVPPWCVPGHDDLDMDTDDGLGPWLRLDVSTRRVSLWPGTEPVGPRDLHSVCMDEDAVRALRDELTAWLDISKVRPL